jgi:hypothetical protein
VARRKRGRPPHRKMIVDEKISKPAPGIIAAGPVLVVSPAADHPWLRWAWRMGMSRLPLRMAFFTSLMAVVMQISWRRIRRRGAQQVKCRFVCSFSPGPAGAQALCLSWGSAGGVSGMAR